MAFASTHGFSRWGSPTWCSTMVIPSIRISLWRSEYKNVFVAFAFDLLLSVHVKPFHYHDLIHKQVSIRIQYLHCLILLLCACLFRIFVYLFFRRHRYMGYRSFVRWCWGYLGKHNRKVLPSCVVARIREAYPSADYTGFRLPPLGMPRWCRNNNNIITTK